MKNYPSLIALASTLALTNAGPIVGGQDTDPKNYPWMVSLRVNGRHDCGGSLIQHNVVLTAAHCLPTGDVVTIKGSNTTLSTGEETHEIERFYIHEGYRRSTAVNDMALLKLKTSSKFTPVKRYDGEKDLAGESVTVIGWGRLTEGGASPTHLQTVTVTGFTNEECKRSYPSNIISNDMFCAGDLAGGKDSCQGDSGGPIFKIENGEPVQVGVVSWGLGCARPKKLGVYNRVAYQQAWIDSKLELINQDPTPSPTLNSDVQCVDEPSNWHDAQGETYTCDWYSQGTNCEEFGDSYMNNGKTAKQACCACSGGSTNPNNIVNQFVGDVVTCDCSAGNGPYDKCVSIDGIERDVCLINYHGGRNAPPKCSAPQVGVLKFSKTYSRWYMEGCTITPKRLNDHVVPNDTPLIEIEQTSSGIDDEDDDEASENTETTILIVGAAVGVIGVALVIGMVVTVKSRKEKDIESLAIVSE